MDDRVRLLCGDCLTLMRDIPDGSVDAVVTDPPWMDYETGRYDASGHHSPIGHIHPEAYAGHLYRVLRDDSAMILWCRWDCFDGHADALKAAGFTVKNCIVWGKPNHTAGDLDGNLGCQHEMAVFATKGDWKRHGKRQSNLWLDGHLFSKTKRHHPTEKPVPLMKRCVELVCPRGQTVLDPFAGSGPTLIACLKTDRKAIGLEIDPRYIPIIERRLAAAATPLFDALPSPAGAGGPGGGGAVNDGAASPGTSSSWQTP